MAERSGGFAREAATLRRVRWDRLHIAALASAAGITLFAYPFLLVTLSWTIRTFQWTNGADIVLQALGASVNMDFHDQAWRDLLIRRSTPLSSVALLVVAAVATIHPVRIAMDGFAGSSGALWRQALKTLVVLPCALLILTTASLTPFTKDAALWWVGSRTGMAAGFVLLALQAVALAASSLAAFLLYRLLPDAAPAVGRSVRLALTAGLLLETLKYSSALLWQPLFVDRIARDFSSFADAAALVVHAYIGVLVVLVVYVFGSRTRMGEHA